MVCCEAAMLGLELAFHVIVTLVYARCKDLPCVNDL